jgi:conjugative transfer pilus assembly protein TraH
MILLMLMMPPFIAATTAGSGVMSNTTKASYIQSQQAHHVVLGGSSKRWPSQRIAMANIKLPSIGSDCSGIDIFKGAFSFIDSQTLISMLKNIGSSAKGFAFYLALETVSPQIASGVKHLAKVVQDMNALNIGSCESAAALIGAVVPRNSKLGENTCKIMKSNSGTLSDFVAARKGCHEGSQTRRDIGTDTSGPLQDVLQEASNVAWYVLKQTAWDDRLKETLMSVTGTVITGVKTITPGRDEKIPNSTSDFKIFPPIAVLNENFFTAFATGGQTDIYVCGDKNKCLAVTTEKRVFSVGETHAEKVKTLLESIEDKIYTNAPLDPLEVSLIEQSRIPILKIINIMSGYHKGKAPISIQMYTDIIAHDLLTQHVKDMLGLIRQIASSLRGAQINEEPLKQYIDQLKMVEKKLKERDEEVYRKADQILQIIQKIQLQEQSIYANMRVLAP